MVTIYTAAKCGLARGFLFSDHHRLLDECFQGNDLMVRLQRGKEPLKFVVPAVYPCLPLRGEVVEHDDVPRPQPAEDSAGQIADKAVSAVTGPAAEGDGNKVFLGQHAS